VFWHAFAGLVDTDNDGSITVEELRQLLIACGDPSLMDPSNPKPRSLVAAATDDPNATQCSIAQFTQLLAKPGIIGQLSLARSPLTHVRHHTYPHAHETIPRFDQQQGHNFKMIIRHTHL
jgi:hypothetical protein